MSGEVQNMGIGGPTNRTDVLRISSRMRTARSSSRPGGGVSTRHPLEQAPPPRPGNPPRPGTHTPARADPPWTEFLTHASENITLPQTSFAGGKNTLLSQLTTG